MTSIIVYTILLFALIVLFYIGTRFNRRDGEQGRLSGLRSWLSTLTSAKGLLQTLGNIQGTVSQTPGKVERDSPEVQKALAVLSDLYIEFQDTIETMRLDMAAALEASQRESARRIQVLEQRVQVLEVALGFASGEAESQAASHKAQSSPVTAGGETVESAQNPGSSVVSSGRVEGNALSLNDLEREILTALNSGRSREEIAKSLGVGQTEVDIVERVFGQVVGAAGQLPKEM